MKTYLEPEEAKLLEEAATNIRDKLLIRLLFYLGCRVSEALAVEVKDIDFTRGTITILHLKRRVRLSCPMCGAAVALSHSYCPKCGVNTNETV
jgi:integrase/recombinase XerD